MAGSQKGTLTIAGSGIASIGHITLETLSYIQEADKIHYAVADPATEAFILDKSKDSSHCFDLTVYYDTNKMRYETYVQMCEVMLRDVRGGYNVLGIFYGHPGVFVSPSHRAIAIARDEGYIAKMLPGVSAEDYMFSDIGFDPAVPGCMSQEATGLLVCKKKLDPSIHNIIWQVGSVGVDTMNREFHILVDRLEEDFGLDHKVVHYIGAVLPQSTTVMDEFTIADLRKEEVVKQITTTSTFYLPPRSMAHIDQDMLQKLRLSLSPVEHVMHVYPRSKWASAESPNPPAYGPIEREAVSHLTNHTIPNDHQFLRGSRPLRQLMVDLALQPGLRNRYKADPASVLDAIPGMSAEEKFALTLNHAAPIFKVMRASRADGEAPTLDEIAGTVNPSLACPAIVVCFVGIMVIVIAL
ncbi:tetrapyrrole methylase [Sanghuangporus baumii]|uniref:Tetrapyrrole methylase n=1 Tax=Sanghuangporus baumii TaxID=108892 RepID=A0A9Q5HV52_SANBA|nr:tetrapyrrole methylase [Sanghuangporus baumii]